MRRSATHRRANGRFRRWLFGLAGLLGLALALSACSDDVEALADGTADEAGTPVAIAVHLRVQRPGAQTRANGSGYAAGDPLAPGEGEYTLGFTKEEMAVRSLTLVMMRVRTDGTEEFERSRTIQSPTDTDNDDVYDATFELTGYSGTKRFYLLANAEPAHIGAFTTAGRVFDAGMEEEGHNIVGKLMNVDSDTGAGSHILMTAAITTAEGGCDIPLAGPTVDDGQGRIDIEIDNPVRLTRAVAKVLLTCHTTGDYVKSDEGGWICLKNVRYILNVLNRKTYMDYRTEETVDGTKYLLDPNYVMSDWIAKRPEGGGYGLWDLEAYRREFLYYDTQGMVNLLNTAVQEYEGITVHPCTSRQATRYDASRLGNNAANHYTEGLYCPENMVHWDLKEMKNAEFLSANRFVTTRVMVGAKYTPKEIWIVDADGVLKKVTAANEDEAHELLNAGLPANSSAANEGDEAGENPGYDDNYLLDTFWRCDESGNAYDEQYFTYEAMMKVISKETVDFNRYDGGWGYYYTYIDKEANEAADAAEKNETIPYERWGVKRNHYYILNVEKIEGPGSAYPGNEMMRIHSRLLDWVDKGSSDVEVDIPQESEEGTL